MPSYVPAGAIQAHKSDDGEEYLIFTAENGFMGVLDAYLFEQVFQREKDIGTMAGDVLSGERRIEDVLAELRPEPHAREISYDLGGVTAEEITRPPITLTARVHELVRERAAVGVPLKPEDLRPAAERMQEQIKARTVPGGPGPGRLPREPSEIEQALQETRRQVDRENLDRGEMNALEGGHRGGIPFGTKLKPGQSPGRGRKVCVRESCNTVNPLKGTTCLGCKKPIKVTERKGAKA